MDPRTERDPLALLDFALSERDWKLAELLMRTVVIETSTAPPRPGPIAAATRAGPRTPEQIVWISRLAQSLGIAD